MRPRLGRLCRPLAVLAALLAVLPALVGGPAVAPRGAAAAAKPNIVLIVTDDQDVGPLAAMPQVKALLADQGTAFTDFLVSAPDCCPSRASILRGQYVHEHGVLRGSSKYGFSAFRRLGHEDSTVATWLRRQGYRTGLVGKYLNGYEADPTHVPPGWSEWYASFSMAYFDYQLNENGRLVAYGHDPEDYQTDVLARKASGFVRRSAKDGKPFFLYLAPSAPHGPATPAPRHAELFPDAAAPRGPAFNEDDVGDKPAYVRDVPPLSPDQIGAIDARYRDRLRSLQAVDEMVATLFAVLRETRRLSTTYVFFTSDNGYLLGEHRLTDKGVPYEEAIRAPLLVRGPEVKHGQVRGELASNIDLAPTIARLAGARVPGFVAGRSLVPLLRGESPATWRRAALVEFTRGDTAGGEVGATAVLDQPSAPAFAVLRTADRAFVEYAGGERELYDLANDREQLRNLADDPARADEVAALSARLAALKACAGAGCRAAEEAA